MARARPQQCDDAAKIVCRAGHVQRPDCLLAARNFCKAFSQPRNRRDEICNTRRDRALWHRRKRRFSRLLDENDPARLLDGRHTQRSIGTGARQNDGDAIATCGRDQAEKHIDRRALAPRFTKRPCSDGIAVDDQLAVWRDHENTVRLQGRGIFDLMDRHSGARGENFVQRTRLFRRKVEDHDIGESKIRRQPLEQALQRRHTAGGSADCADRHEFLATRKRKTLIVGHPQITHKNHCPVA